MYRKWESNPHIFRYGVLNPARLPIPPSRQFFVPPEGLEPSLLAELVSKTSVYTFHHGGNLFWAKDQSWTDVSPIPTVCNCRYTTLAFVVLVSNDLTLSTMSRWHFPIKLQDFIDRCSRGRTCTRIKRACPFQGFRIMIIPYFLTPPLRIPIPPYNYLSSFVPVSNRFIWVTNPVHHLLCLRSVNGGKFRKWFILLGSNQHLLYLRQLC